MNSRIILFASLNFLAICVLQASAKEDYCKIQEEACNEEPHIACKGFCTDDSCKAQLKKCSNLKMVPITDDLKKLILHKHNQFRNEIAGAHILGFPPASRMLKMVCILRRRQFYDL